MAPILASRDPRESSRRSRSSWHATPVRAAHQPNGETRDGIKEVRLVLEILESRYSDPENVCLPAFARAGEERNEQVPVRQCDECRWH